MLILLPVLLPALAAFLLLILHYARPQFKYTWSIAALGAILALAGAILWQIRFPAAVKLLPWQPLSVFDYTPLWLADSVSWPYALAVTALTAAVILTSVVRNENLPFLWAGTLLLAAIGILAIAAGDPVTLVLVWAVFDLAELAVMTGSIEGESRAQNAILAYAVRVTGMGFVILAVVMNAAARLPTGFEALSRDAGLLLLIGAGLRLGVLPLRLPYRGETVLRRGFGTTLRLVSAAASLSVIGRIPPAVLDSPLTPFLLAATCIPALYGGWMWLRASDELVGRPFWVLGLASLSVAAALRGSPTGSVGWGVALVAGGGLLFLYSARQRNLLWLLAPGLWALSALPFSVSASAWLGGASSWLFLLAGLPAQALLMAGFVRHALHPGETSFESQERWSKALYPLGLFLLAGAAILPGLWGWAGARTIGPWGLALTAIGLSGAFFLLAVKITARASPVVTQWGDVIRLGWLYRSAGAVFRFLQNLAGLITFALEGDGGILWSLLLMVLILTLLSAGGR
jgi:hypothetical protein